MPAGSPSYHEWPGTRFTVPAHGAWSEALLKSLGFEGGQYPRDFWVPRGH
jgi:hypothetical protein